MQLLPEERRARPLPGEGPKAGICDERVISSAKILIEAKVVSKLDVLRLLW